MYLAALRPGEAVALRRQDCHLPETGWGHIPLGLERLAATPGDQQQSLYDDAHGLITPEWRVLTTDGARPGGRRAQLRLAVWRLPEGGLAGRGELREPG